VAVAEKSDGVRHLLFVTGGDHAPNGTPTACLFDRALRVTPLDPEVRMMMLVVMMMMMLMMMMMMMI
jgi:hypothetical protein